MGEPPAAVGQFGMGFVCTALVDQESLFD